MDLKFKVHNVGPLQDNGALRAVMAVPDLDDADTALAMGVTVGTKNEHEGSKLLLNHVSHEEQDQFVKGRVLNVSIEFGEVKAPPASVDGKLPKARKKKKS